MHNLNFWERNNFSQPASPDKERPLPTRIDSPALSFTAGGYYVCTPKWTTHTIETVQEQRIYFGLQGEAHVFLDGKRYTIRGGEVCFIPAYRPARHLCENRPALY